MLYTMNDSQVHQAILARDIIDMARDNAANPDILEYIDSICWELFMIFRGQHQKVIEWDTLSATYDRQYTALRKGENIVNPPDVDVIYSRAVHIIESHYKDES